MNIAGSILPRRMRLVSPRSQPVLAWAQAKLDARRLNDSQRMHVRKKVVIVGAGFAGLNAAKQLQSRRKDVDVIVIDRENHHLFQPLLYQVAMAALSPADIAVPIRSLLERRQRARHQGDCAARRCRRAAASSPTCGEFAYDYLLLACGAQHSYFGHEKTGSHCAGPEEPAAGHRDPPPRAGGLRSGRARERYARQRRRYLTFVVVGGGPTGVELAGAIGEMSRYTLAKDFRSIDPRQTRVILVEAGPRILPTFDQRPGGTRHARSRIARRAGVDRRAGHEYHR